MPIIIGEGVWERCHGFENQFIYECTNRTCDTGISMFLANQEELDMLRAELPTEEKRYLLRLHMLRDRSVFPDVVESLIKKGLLRKSGGMIQITSAGKLWVDYWHLYTDIDLWKWPEEIAGDFSNPPYDKFGNPRPDYIPPLPPGVYLIAGIPGSEDDL